MRRGRRAEKACCGMGARREEAARILLAMATADLKLAEWAAGFDNDIALQSQAAFHCQQCVEKALKAVMVTSGVEEVPRTHDLTELYRRLAGASPAPECDITVLARISSWAVRPRYLPIRKAERKELDAMLNEARRILNEAQEIANRQFRASTD